MKSIGLTPVIAISILPVLADAMPNQAQDNEHVESSLAVSAQSIQSFSMSALQYQQLDDNAQLKIAARWQLKPAQYQQYLWLMHNTPSGHWYSKLDPAEVLGINAKNEQERAQYARIVAKAAFERAGRELAMQHAYDQAMQALYPQQKPIEARPHKTIHLQASDRIFVVMNQNNVVANTVMLPLLKKLEAGQYTSLNLYFTDDKLANNEIRRWAAQKNIPVALVTSDRVTLNHANQEFKSMWQKSIVKPLVLLNRDNHWLPLPSHLIWQGGRGV